MVVLWRDQHTEMRSNTSGNANYKEYFTNLFDLWHLTWLLQIQLGLLDTGRDQISMLANASVPYTLLFTLLYASLNITFNLQIST